MVLIELVTIIGSLSFFTDILLIHLKFIWILIMIYKENIGASDLAQQHNHLMQTQGLEFDPWYKKERKKKKILVFIAYMIKGMF